MSGAPHRLLRGAAGWAAAVIFVLVASTVALCLGPARGIGPLEVWQVLTGGAAEIGTADVVLTVRLPQVLLGLLVGAALSVSGTLFQALLRNDLAEPYLLGVGPGAMLGVTVAALLAAGGVAGDAPAALRGGLAFLGALGVAAVVFSFARRGGRTPAVTVLLAGVAVGAFVHALAAGALYTAVPDWHQIVRWLLGDLSLAEYGDLAWLGGAVLVGGVLAFVLARDLDVLSLGEEAAWFAGVEVRVTLYALGGAGCLLAAAAVAHCGLVGFVGLVVPHLARRLFGPAHRGLIPAAALIGAGLLVLADGLARALNHPEGIPLAVVTAALGAPVLAWLVLRRAPA